MENENKFDFYIGGGIGKLRDIENWGDEKIAFHLRRIAQKISPRKQKPKKIVIPKEVIWSKYSEYKSHKLGCYEIVKSRIENMYCKLLISNMVDVGDMKKGGCDLSHFQCPSGKSFDSSKWRVGKHGSPKVIE